MGTQEVVVCGEEDDQRESAVVGLEAAGWADVEFEGSVEAFDQLFEGAVGFGFLVEILQADDGMVLNARYSFRAFFVHEVDAGGIGWVSVGYESDLLLRVCGSDGFGHGNDSGFRFAGMREMVGGEYEVL